MKTLKIGVIGFRHGHVADLVEKARRHPLTEIVAAAEGDAAARRWAEETLGVPVNDTEAQAVIESDADIVAVGDVFARRGEIAIAALRAGKHVLLDKPICTSLTELDEMERLTRSANLVVGAMLDLRDQPAARTARRLMREKRIGTVHAVQFTGQHPLNYGQRPAWYFMPGMQGGTINDIGIHGIDMIRWLTGAEMTKICAARCWNAFAAEVPDFRDCAQLMAEFSGGIGVMGDVSYAAPAVHGYVIAPYWRFNLWGTEGMMEFCFASPEVTLCMKDSTRPERVPAEPFSDTYFDNFIREIMGQDTELNTHEVFASTRATLTLQAAADGLL